MRRSAKPRKRKLRDEANRYKHRATIERLFEETGKPFAEGQAASEPPQAGGVVRLGSCLATSPSFAA